MPNSLNEELIEAACVGDTVRIKNLIAQGANVNYQNEQINTVLMWAVTHRHVDAAQQLLNAGADINGQDVLGGTALIVAAGNGDMPMVEMLLKRGADVHLKDAEGNTAFTWAEHNRHNQVTRLLQDLKSSLSAEKSKKK